MLYENLLRLRGEAMDGGNEAGALIDSLSGADRVGEVVMVDQSPLARTPRSSPALYLGIFDGITRDFSRPRPMRFRRGSRPSAFSFNSGTGRCERCSGSGFEKVEMQFLSDVYLRCPECEGKRYQAHVLKVRLAGKSIHDVLELTVTGADQLLLGSRRRVAGAVAAREKSKPSSNRSAFSRKSASAI